MSEESETTPGGFKMVHLEPPYEEDRVVQQMFNHARRYLNAPELQFDFVTLIKAEDGNGREVHVYVLCAECVESGQTYAFRIVSDTHGQVVLLPACQDEVYVCELDESLLSPIDRH